MRQSYSGLSGVTYEGDKQISKHQHLTASFRTGKLRKNHYNRFFKRGRLKRKKSSGIFFPEYVTVCPLRSENVHFQDSIVS